MSIRFNTSPSLTAHFIVHGDFSRIETALQSHLATTTIPCQTFLTINTGPGPHLDPIRSKFPEVHIHVNNSPAGFAANHNRILRETSTDYIALLNDDIELRENALDMLVNYLEVNPRVGVAGPYLLNANGTPQAAVYSDPSLFRMLYKISGLARLTRQTSLIRQWLQHLGLTRLLKVESLNTQAATRLVPVVKGAVMVVRRRAYEQVGPMDETTLAYGEEIDWHWRMRQAGWQVAHVAEAHVIHFGTGQIELDLRGGLLLEDRKAILNYFIKHRPHWQTLILRAAIITTHLAQGFFWFPFVSTRARENLSIAAMGLKWRRQ